VIETRSPERPVVARLSWQRAMITRIVDRVPRVRSYFFKLSVPFQFRAGQHVNVRLTAPDGYQAERSYSIASAPEAADGLELVIERLEDGEISPYFHDVAAVGDDIELRGPIGGHFVWSTAEGGPLLLVGGGSGVVPLMCMIRHRAALASDVPTRLLLSARTWDDVIFRDELLELQSARTGLDLTLALTRASAHRDGDYGRRVDSAMMTDVLRHWTQPPHYVFVCGSNAFVEAAARGMIDAGIPVDIIRTERYGG
jgi:ferredoxin-NADP reductase